MATKSLILNPRNRERGIAVINSLVTLHDSETGLPLAVVDGNWVKARRTAGLSAVAAKRLARPNSVSIGFIGCGVEARSHLDAFCDLFPVRQIYTFGRGSENRDALCRAAEARGLVAIASKIPREAIGDADLIVTSVTLLPNLDPFLDARWLKPGAFVTSIDLALPWLPEAMGAFQRIVIDDLEQEAKMSGPMVAPALVTGDLSGLLCGEIAGREGWLRWQSSCQDDRRDFRIALSSDQCISNFALRVPTAAAPRPKLRTAASKCAFGPRSV